MRVRRLPFVVLPFAVAAVLAVAASGAGPLLGTAKPVVKPAKPARTINLATYDARRWIVQLRGAPLARIGLAGAYHGTRNATAASRRLSTSSARAAAYVSGLKATQHAFARQLVRSLPGAKVQRNYQVVLNGLAVKMTKKQAAAVRLMPGVRAVTPDIPFKLQMFATPAQIGAPTLWGQVGGQANAGAGVKVAVIDSGIFVRYDKDGNYTGNPCFDDAGYTAP